MTLPKDTPSPRARRVIVLTPQIPSADDGRGRLFAVCPRNFDRLASTAWRSAAAARASRRMTAYRCGLDAFLEKSGHIPLHVQIARLAHALRPGPVPTGQMRKPARVVVRPFPNCSTHRQGRHGARVRRGRQPADAVFRAGPRDAQARRVRLREIRQEGAVFRSFIQN